MSIKFLKLNTTDGDSIFGVAVSASNIVFFRPILVSKTVKTKIVFNGGVELNVIESVEEIERKLKGDSGQIIPFRRE